MKLSICFLIRSLNAGGAERQVILLAKGLARKGHRVSLITFYDGGSFSDELKDEPGLRHFTLGKRNRWDLASPLRLLAGLLGEIKPDVLHTYLTTSNLIGAAFWPCIPNSRLVWGVRSSTMDWRHYGRLYGLALALERVLARVPSTIISNSRTGLALMKIPRDRAIVIFNGVDTDLYKPDPDLGLQMRAQLSIPANAVLVGLAARLDPMKDHETFLQAARILRNQKKEFHFVCIGDGPPELRQSLMETCRRLDLESAITWLGFRADMPRIYNALDISCSTSAFGEGFSNSLAESMACGIPCVATDVGDSTVVVGDTGILVPPRAPELFARGVSRLAEHLNPALKSQVRDRIMSKFSLDRLISQTEESLQGLVARGRSKTACISEWSCTE